MRWTVETDSRIEFEISGELEPYTEKALNAADTLVDQGYTNDQSYGHPAYTIESFKIWPFQPPANIMEDWESNGFTMNVGGLNSSWDMRPIDVEIEGTIRNRDEVEEMMTHVYNATERSLYEPLQYDTKIWVTGHRKPDDALIALEDTEIGFVAVFKTDRKFVDVGYLTSQISDSEFGIEIRDNLGNNHQRLYQNTSQQLDDETSRLVGDLQRELAEEGIILD